MANLRDYEEFRTAMFERGYCDKFGKYIHYYVEQLVVECETELEFLSLLTVFHYEALEIALHDIKHDRLIRILTAIKSEEKKVLIKNHRKDLDHLVRHGYVQETTHTEVISIMNDCYTKTFKAYEVTYLGQLMAERVEKKAQLRFETIKEQFKKLGIE